MKFILLALALIPAHLTSQPIAHAAPVPPATYELDMNLKFDGKLMSSPRVVVLDGQSAVLSDRGPNGGTYIEATVVGEKQGVLMKFALGTMDAEGKRVVYARPQVIAAENQAATINVKESEGGAPADVTFTVTARKAER